MPEGMVRMSPQRLKSSTSHVSTGTLVLIGSLGLLLLNRVRAVPGDVRLTWAIYTLLGVVMLTATVFAIATAAAGVKCLFPSLKRIDLTGLIDILRILKK
jgi:hypothetical protein